MGRCCKWTPSLTCRERLFHTTSPLAARPALHTPTPLTWHWQNSLSRTSLYTTFRLKVKMVRWLWNQFCGLQQFCEFYIYKTGLSRKYQNVSHIVIITIFLEPCFCYMCLFTYVHKTVWFGLQYKNKFLTVSSWYGKNVSDWTALSFHLWFEKSLLPYVKFSQVNMPIQGSLFCS